MIRQEKLRELDSYIRELKTIKMSEGKQIDRGFLHLEQYTCSLNNGKTITREKILKNGKDGSASTILPITNEGNIILVVQPRVFTSSTVGVELPAGYIEETEQPSYSASRELEEETGYEANEIVTLAKYYQDQGCSAALNYSFLALGCKKNKEQNLDKDEYIRYFECTFEEMLELLDIGYIRDANSIITIERARNYIREYGIDINRSEKKNEKNR